MLKIVIVFALAVLAQVEDSFGKTVDCYKCQDATCLEDKTKWETVSACGKAVNATTEGGACLTYVYTDTKANKTVTERNCVTGKWKGHEIDYTCAVVAGRTTDKCQLCYSDLCNSGSSVTLSIVSLFGVIAVLLIPKLI